VAVGDEDKFEEEVEVEAGGGGAEAEFGKRNPIDMQGIP
jgi:hypothetical protein